VALTYNADIFAVSDVQQAMSIILTAEDSTTEERWRLETGYIADMIEKQLAVSPASMLLDYGCGIGRLAKELVERQGCSVLGVDISAHMRMLGVSYVRSERFASASREMLDAMVTNGFQADAAISIWCLQHCCTPAEDVALIAAALKPGAPLFIVNNHGRAVPTVEEGWVDDGIDIKALLREQFELDEEGRLDPRMTTPDVSQHTFWARFRRLDGALPGQ
jgi:SAM-dependent methyltransferase